MIERLELFEGPLIPGEERFLKVWGAEPHLIEIKCFVSNPPPSGFRPCPECGKFRVMNGDLVTVTASEETFAAKGGALIIHIRDSQGDEREVRLQVKQQIAASGQGEVAVAH